MGWERGTAPSCLYPFFEPKVIGRRESDLESSNLDLSTGSFLTSAEDNKEEEDSE